MSYFRGLENTTDVLAAEDDIYTELTIEIHQKMAFVGGFLILVTGVWGGIYAYKSGYCQCSGAKVYPIQYLDLD